MGTTFAILAGLALFALFAKQYHGGPENLSIKPRKRSIRAKWKGAGEPPAEFKPPKYKVGQKVAIRSPHEKDQFEGKVVTITERIYYEVVEADPSGTMLPVPGAETWGYVVDLTFDGLPLNVAETSLVPEGTAVSGEEEKPAHGRTAKCEKAKWSEVATKILRSGTKALFTAFAGPYAGKGLDAAYDAMGLGAKNVKADELAAFLNTASNADVYLWAIAWVREQVTKTYADPKSKKFEAHIVILRALHVTVESFAALDTAARATFKVLLWLAKLNLGPLPSQFVDCALQAMVIVEYKKGVGKGRGPLGETWKIVKGALKKRPKFDWRKPDTLSSLNEWADATLRELEPYRDKAAVKGKE